MTKKDINELVGLFGKRDVVTRLKALSILLRLKSKVTLNIAKAYNEGYKAGCADVAGRILKQQAGYN